MGCSKNTYTSRSSKHKNSISYPLENGLLLNSAIIKIAILAVRDVIMQTLFVRSTSR